MYHPLLLRCSFMLPRDMHNVCLRVFCCAQPPKIQTRVTMSFDDVARERVLSDGWWAMFWRMGIQPMAVNTPERFYDDLLPLLVLSGPRLTVIFQYHTANLIPPSASASSCFALNALFGTRSIVCLCRWTSRWTRPSWRLDHTSMTLLLRYARISAPGCFVLDAALILTAPIRSPATVACERRGCSTCSSTACPRNTHSKSTSTTSCSG